MTEELGRDEAGPAGDAAALGIAMNADRSSAEEARAYLREQTELAKLQKQNLLEKNAFELSHLRFRRFSDWARFALESAAFVFALFVLIGLGSMVWRAAADRSLVVDAFDVPQALAQRGLTGQVLARRILNRLHQIQLESVSARNTQSYRAGAEGRIDFDIPQAGISLLQLQALLNDWLGQTTHVSGALIDNAPGLTLAVQFGDTPESVIAQPGGEIEPLIQETAERIYRHAEPYRYANFLRHTGRTAEALPQLMELALSGDAEDRKWAVQDWGALVGQTAQGDRRKADTFAVQKMRDAIAIDSNYALGWAGLAIVAHLIGHDEQSLAAAQRASTLILRSNLEDYEPKRREADLHATRSAVASLEGDYQKAIAEQFLVAACDRAIFGPEVIVSDALHRAEAFIGDHDLAAAERILADLDASGPFYAAMPASSQWRIKFVRNTFHQEMAFAKAEWNAVRATEAGLTEASGVATFTVPLDQARLLTALAAAHAVDFADAHRAIAATPVDCYNCLRTRGTVDALHKNWGGAAYWYARAVSAGPSLPFAYVDWGEMLQREGRFDDAIAKFAVAHDKGPHFADPLEMWGEALMAKNRSDLALAKFEEANKCASNWGRLHFKWGEALSYAGKKDDAQKQFERAASLDLAPTDSLALQRWMKGHGSTN